ncbi:MAG: hypothetical protein RIF42_07990 [Parvibaculaceae bacterium]|nr:hypothetical protein [Marinovum sp. PR37]MDD9746060.1 hypothetical protein [Marinovum sp. PR37]
MPLSNIKFFDQLKHHRDLDVFRSLLFGLPADVCTAITQLDVLRPKLVSVANPTGCVLGQVEPATGHGAAPVPGEELRLVLRGPSDRTALLDVVALHPKDGAVLGIAFFFSPLVERPQGLQAGVPRPSEDAKGVADMRESRLRKVRGKLAHANLLVGREAIAGLAQPRHSARHRCFREIPGVYLHLEPSLVFSDHRVE